MAKVEVIREIQGKRLYVGGQHTLELDVGAKNQPLDITGASVLMRFRKPDGTAGSFPAIITDATRGVIERTFLVTDLDLEGVWTFWAQVTFASGQVIPGNPVKIAVFTQGEQGLT